MTKKTTFWVIAGLLIVSVCAVILSNKELREKTLLKLNSILDQLRTI